VLSYPQQNASVWNRALHSPRRLRPGTANLAVGCGREIRKALTRESVSPLHALSPLEQLKDGVRRFRQEVYPAEASIFQRVESEPQQTHTLFITCADSRVDPIALTQSGPGEIFVMRNIGNLVPAYGEMLGGVSAVIEFAVTGLKVQHIAVCGHSDCGAMKALLQPESTGTMPTVRSWLTNAKAALGVAETLHGRAERKGDLLSLVTEQNVLLQLQHLRTHPSVASALAAGELSLSGWVYDIGQGEVRIAEDASNSFAPVDGESSRRE
jgi:carbonic anhydrase